MTLNTGFLLNNRYRIISILGQGGMGAVYRAQDENLDIPVAVKENLYLSDEFTRQFQREATILANVKHLNLPRVVDYFIVSNQGQYLIMDYIEGEDLRQRIERMNSLPPQDAILIGIEICNALDYLHNRNPSVVHRDIKPGNIKITPESEIYLVDFGLAKIMQGSQVTITGARAMTPGYSPPEQYGTARTDARSDIYSLGATLYAALTGVIPEDGLARATGKSQLTPVRQIQPRIDRRLAAVIEKCLAVEPGDRFQSANELKMALIEAGQLSQLTHQRPVVSPPPITVIDNGSANLMSDSSSSWLPSSQYLKPRSFHLFRWIMVSLSALIVILFGTTYFYNYPFPFTQLYSLFNNQTPLFSNTQTVEMIPSATASLVQVNSPVVTQFPTLLPTATTRATDHPAISLPLDTPVPPQPTPAGGGVGLISFVSKRTGALQVWVMNSDGTQQRQLSNMLLGVCQPAWSPDGTKLAVISPCYRKDTIYTDTKIYILNSDGSNPVPLPVTQEGDFDPAWSPDGKRIAFTSIRTGVPHVFVYNFEDKSLSELSDTHYADIQPSWSPGGKQLAISRKDLYYHIWILSDLGQSQFQFSSSGNVNDLWPVWSYDNQFIMYGRSQETNGFPWLMKMNYEDRGTGVETRIPSLNEESFGPISEAHLSPDQNWFAYEGWPDGHNHDIFIKSFQPGSQPLRLTTDPEMDFSPVWNPPVQN